MLGEYILHVLSAKRLEISLIGKIRPSCLSSGRLLLFDSDRQGFISLSFVLCCNEASLSKNFPFCSFYVRLHFMLNYMTVFYDLRNSI